MRGIRYSNLIYSVVIALVMISESKGQDVFEGTIQNYNQPAAFVTAGMMVLFEIGTVDADGSFSIPLNDDFINKMKNSIEQDNENMDDWTAQLITTGRMFNCSSGNVDVTNKDLPIIKLSSYGSYMIADPEEEVQYGYFMATSSIHFTEAFNSFGQIDAVEGYYVDWFYFEEPLTVSGSCGVETYAMNQEDIYVKMTHYDLEFNAGWNLVKYEVADVYDDPDGTNMPLEIAYSTLDTVPDEVIYHFFE